MWKNGIKLKKKNSKKFFSVSYAIIRNIPKELRSKDLRKYFKRFIEAEKFQCFHYRHRPELQAESVGFGGKNDEKNGF